MYFPGDGAIVRPRSAEDKRDKGAVFDRNSVKEFHFVVGRPLGYNHRPLIGGMDKTWNAR